MKNTIIYYYNLVPSRIEQKNNIYYLKINNKKYIFMPNENDTNDLLTIYNFLINIRLYCHEIIYNINNDIITLYKNIPYTLIKLNYNNEGLITIKNIIHYNVFVEAPKKCIWSKLWSIKIDYYEIQLREFGKKYPLIRDSFSYYNGLCETAICLINTIKKYNNNMFLCHKRISSKLTIEDFYNPLNFTIDVRVRDFSEYFKIKYFNNKLDIQEIQNYLLEANLNYSETILFFSRLIYPTYYFDMYDEIIQGKTNEDKLYYYIDKIEAYELFLKKVYFIINKHYQIPQIEWILKK